MSGVTEEDKDAPLEKNETKKNLKSIDCAKTGARGGSKVKSAR